MTMMMIRKYLLTNVLRDAENGGGAGAGAAGAASGGAAVGGAAGGAAAGGAAAGGAAAGGAAAGGAAAGGAAAAPWYGEKLPEADVSYITAKGVKDLSGLIKVANDFEGLARNRNVFEKPDAEKIGEWKHWQDLGWEPDATKYAQAIKPPQEKNGVIVDKQMFQDFAAAAHELKIPVKQAEAAYARVFDKMAERIMGAQAAGAQASKDLDIALRNEWGDNYEPKKTLAQQAFRAFGVDADTSAELEKITGSPKLLKLFAAIGDKLGEDVLRTNNDGGSQGGKTPAQARVERQQLEADPKWFEIFNNPRHALHQQHVDQRQALIKIEAAAQKK